MVGMCPYTFVKTQRVNPSENYGLYLIIIMCQHWFGFSEWTTLMGDINNRRKLCVGGEGDIWKLSRPSVHSFCEPKNTLKIKSINVFL